MAAENAIREAMAASIGSVSGFQVDGYVPDTIQPPCLYVAPGRIDYHQASQDGLENREYTVWAVLPMAASRAAQQELGTLRDTDGAGSLKAALEADRTLGGLIDHLTVKTASPISDYVLPQTQAHVLACTWTVGVMD